jgi:aryl-alcohol dehydrogenase-like predicted oxidoreductase
VPETRLVLGTAGLGGLRYGLHTEVGRTQVESAAVVAAAVHAGITVFDTAPSYGEAESWLGQALPKVATVWTKVQSASDATGIVRSVGESVARLGRAVDLVQWHNWSKDSLSQRSFQQAIDAVRQLPDVRSVGATTYGAEDALAAVQSGAFSLVQIEWNLLNQEVLAKIRDSAAGRVSIALRSILLQGALTDPRSPRIPQALRSAVLRAEQVARNAGMPLFELAIRASLSTEAEFVILGADTPRQVEALQTVAARGPLEADLIDAIRSLDVPDRRLTDPRIWNVG